VTTAKTFAPLIVLATLLAACSSTPLNPPASATAQTTPSATAPATRASTGASQQPAPTSTVTTVTLPAYLDPKSPISTDRSVYFDFDQFAVKPEYTALIDRQGTYLASRPTLSIKVEGNTDERGGAEYNLALGQRRAEAVLRALRIYGVKDSQMEAISWGEERPRVAGHDETAWAQNRRVDLQYPRQ
jgi:peptidoglycan-associated lipoprotein